jgi:hypothetical protein
MLNGRQRFICNSPTVFELTSNVTGGQRDLCSDLDHICLENWPAVFALAPSFDSLVAGPRNPGEDVFWRDMQAVSCLTTPTFDSSPFTDFYCTHRIGAFQTRRSNDLSNSG